MFYVHSGDMRSSRTVFSKLRKTSSLGIDIVVFFIHCLLLCTQRWLHLFECLLWLRVRRSFGLYRQVFRRCLHWLSTRLHGTETKRTLSHSWSEVIGGEASWSNNIHTAVVMVQCVQLWWWCSIRRALVRIVLYMGIYFISLDQWAR